MYFEFDFELNDIIIASLFAFSLYITFCSPKKHCACGVKIPERGGMCECGEYNSRAVIKIDTPKQKVFEDELKRIEEEKRKGNSYDTFL